MASASACGAEGTPEQAETHAASPATAALPGQFAVLRGRAIREAIDSQKGRVVVLNLWATWCGPCRNEFPALVEFEKRYRDRGLTVLAVSVDEPEEIDEKVKPFVAETGAEFRVLVKAPGDPMAFMDALSPRLSGALPETIIYDRAGNVVRVLTGEQSLGAFEDSIRDLL